MDTNVLTVTLAALVTALATGLGAIPLRSRRASERRWLGLSAAIASGFMLSASLALLVEGGLKGVGRTAAGAVAGATLVALAHRALAGRQDLHVGALRGADARKAILIVVVMTVHSFAEGVGVGVSFGGGDALGVFITLAIAVHNIPEGLAISLVLVPRGARLRAASWWSVVSSLPQPLMAAPAFLFVEAFHGLLPAGLGFAAGAMVWLVHAELLPDARRGASPGAVAVALGGSFAAMSVLQLLVLA